MFTKRPIKHHVTDTPSAISVNRVSINQLCLYQPQQWLN